MSKHDIANHIALSILQIHFEINQRVRTIKPRTHIMSLSFIRLP